MLYVAYEFLLSYKMYMGLGVLFKFVRTLMWPQNCQMSIFRSIHLQHWYPNVNIQIDPFATLVPKLPNVNIQIDPFATLVPKLPNVNIQIDPFATLVPKCQYSDRIHSQSGWLGPQSEYNHLAGAAIRTRNHNYEEHNYDLNAHPHMYVHIQCLSKLFRSGRQLIIPNNLIVHCTVQKVRHH